MYRSLTCLGGDYDQFAKFFAKLMKQFSWRHVTFVYHQVPAWHTSTFCPSSYNCLILSLIDIKIIFITFAIPLQEPCHQWEGRYNL